MQGLDETQNRKIKQYKAVHMEKHELLLVGGQTNLIFIGGVKSWVPCC